MSELSVDVDDNKSSMSKPNMDNNKQQEEGKSGTTSTSNLSMTSKRTVRLVYCSDGVVEECDEDVEEQQRAEREAREKEMEERRKLDLEAVFFRLIDSNRLK